MFHAILAFAMFLGILHPDLEKATFAAGCFWGVEAKFRKVPGVIDTQVGYTGGEVENPTYQQVCQKTTGHAEAIEILFDPKLVTYEQLLEIFWSTHNPAHKNASQYRSAIFTNSPEQAEMANRQKEAMIQAGKKIATEIVPAGPFYRAEEYHQRYIEKKGCGCGSK